MSNVSQETTLTATIEFDDEYADSVDSEFYLGHIGGDRTLDIRIDEEKAKRVEIYRDRLEKGLDLFKETRLPLSDLCDVRGLGDYRLENALKELTQEERSWYNL